MWYRSSSSSSSSSSCSSSSTFFFSCFLLLVFFLSAHIPLIHSTLFSVSRLCHCFFETQIFMLFLPLILSLHLHPPPHPCAFTLAPSPLYPHPCTLTLAPSPLYPHPCTLTLASSPLPPCFWYSLAALIPFVATQLRRQSSESYQNLLVLRASSYNHLSTGQ